MTDAEKLTYIKHKVMACSMATMIIEKAHEDDLDAKGLLNIIYSLCEEILEVFIND